MSTTRKAVNNPFPGLRPFATDEYRLFFGREGQSDELLARLERSRFLAVVGTSGSGKSSLIRAGLMPALLGGMMKGAGSGWRIAIMRPGGDPIGNLAAELVKKGVLSEAGAGLSENEAEAVIEATLRSGSLGIVNVSRQARLSEHEKLLVVVDQFEELFRFRAAHEGTSVDEAAAFVKLLLEASQQRELAIYIVLTMRSDFLGDCAQFQGLPEAINDGQYLIPRMTRDERRFAVTGPVGVTRGKITEALVNRLLNDVGDNPDQLPILQHALMRTWDHWQTYRRDGEPIGIDHYEAIGTMSDALSLHADEAYNELPDESRRIAEILFKALSERGADNREVRRPTRLGTICKIAEANMADVIAVIDVFRGGGRSFLMPPAGTALNADSVIDISHESLIRNWQRLKKWVEEEAQSARIYRRLAEAAVLHREGSEALVQDPALQFALDWHQKTHPNAAWGQRYHPEFDTAIDYLEKSRDAREERIAAEEARRNEAIERDRRELEQTKLFVAQQQRAARRMRWLIAALCLILLFAIATAGFAFSQRRDALESRRVALAEKKSAVDAAAALRVANDKAEERRIAAEAAEDKAVAAKRATIVEQIKAEKAAELAIEQKYIAVQNLHAAQVATQQAKAASEDARNKAKEVQDSLDRSFLIRRGLESSRRENFPLALDSFQQLHTALAKLQPATSAGNRFTADQSTQLRSDYGWALTRLADSQKKLEQYPEAVQNYEKALVVLEKLRRGDPEPILLETYRGLAQAYQESGQYSVITVEIAGKPTTLDPQQQFARAEEFYKKLADHHEQFKSTKPQDAAFSVVDLAHFYNLTGRYAEAEQRLKSVIDIYKNFKKDQGLPSAETLDALKELAEFYRARDRNADAARTYNELIDLQEGPLYDKLDADGIRKLVDNYSELAEVYSLLKQKELGDAALQLADKIQHVARKVKHSESTITSPEALAKITTFTSDIDEMGDIYVKLGRLEGARRSYEIALSIRETADFKNDPPAKSHLKLAELYMLQKNYEKAEFHYKQLLTHLKNTKPPVKFERSLLNAYVDGIEQLTILYTDYLNKPTGAVEELNSAFAALSANNVTLPWDDEEAIYSAVLKLYEKQKKTPQEIQALRERQLERMIKRRETLTNNAPVDFLVMYIAITDEVADFYLAQNDKQRASEVYGKVLMNIPAGTIRRLNSTELETYAKTHEKFQSVLRDLNKPTTAALFDSVVKAARARQKYLQELARDAGEPVPAAPAPPKQ